MLNNVTHRNQIEAPVGKPRRRQVAMVYEQLAHAAGLHSSFAEFDALNIPA